MPDFLAWQRPAVYALATTPRAGVRLAAQLPVTLHDDAGDVAAAASFLLAGPGDVERLTAGQIIGRRPHPGTHDAEATMMAHVELAAPDLPWRYTPEPHTGAPALRPWLVLVVGTPAEVSLEADGRVALGQRAPSRAVAQLSATAVTSGVRVASAGVASRAATMWSRIPGKSRTSNAKSPRGSRFSPRTLRKTSGFVG